MARRYGEPIAVIARRGQPTAFTWRGVTYRVRVIGTWRLATRWWEASARVDRVYFRVQTADQQVFELYREAATEATATKQTKQTKQDERWMLDICQD